MRILFILIIFFLLHKTNCFNLFKSTKIYNKLFIKTQQKNSNLEKQPDIQEQEDIQEKQGIQEQQNIQVQDDIQDLAKQQDIQDLTKQQDIQVSKKDQNDDSLLKTIVDLPKNIAYITLLGIVYLGVSAYLFGTQIRKKLNEKNNL